MKLENKVSIVTGASQGIGKATALMFADEGADVVIVDMLEAGREVCDQIQSKGRKTAFFKVDVSNSAQVKEMVKWTLDEFGHIDVLANIAGIVKNAPIEDYSEEDFDTTIAVNLKGTFLCCQEVGKVMIKQGGGTIVNTASIAGHTPQIGLGAYSPSKAGVMLLTKVMAVEWAKYQIRVNAVSPGPITTPLTEKIYNTPEKKAQRAKAVPMDRFADPNEVARVFTFFASDDSSYITAQSLLVDGGSFDAIFHLIKQISD
jgi:NAD(P)-dependent dehydrogenase (short-subunit alcohol dehydrogenase family)